MSSQQTVTTITTTPTTVTTQKKKLKSLNEIKKTDKELFNLLVALIVVLLFVFIITPMIGVIIHIRYPSNMSSYSGDLYGVYSGDQYEPYRQSPPTHLLHSPESSQPVTVVNKNNLSTLFNGPTHTYPSITSPPINPQTQLPIAAKKIVSPIGHPSLATPLPIIKKLAPSVAAHLGSDTSTHPSVAAHLGSTSGVSNDSFISHGTSHSDPTTHATHTKHHRVHKAHVAHKASTAHKKHHFCSIS